VSRATAAATRTPAASTITASAWSAASASPASATRTTASSAITAPIRSWALGRTFWRSGNSCRSIAIEVWLIVFEVSPALDGQRGCATRRAFTVIFLVTFVAFAIRTGFSAAHLRALFLEDGFA
jgi:hypothetical protein